MIKIENYTAYDLWSSYDISELEAYKYLIYLREKPKETLEYLKKGLPQ